MSCACFFLYESSKPGFESAHLEKNKLYSITAYIPLGKVLLILDYFQTFLLNKGHIPSRSKGIKTCYQQAGSFILLNFDMK